nr:sugar O-acetyltransferase [Agrilactobacillus yilanensis]
MMQTAEILQRALAGERLDFYDAEFRKIEQIAERTTELLTAFNTTYSAGPKRRQLMSQIVGYPIPEDTEINAPLYSDFGQHLFIGAGVFINRNCTFVDLGGIYLADGVLIGPNVSLISVNHVAAKDAHRRDILPKAIHIEKNAWIGANATVLPGVTVGENAIVGAGSVVTKDVAANTVVAGNPSRFIKNI